MIAPVLETTRLRLDAVTPADTDAVFEYCQDADIQKWIPIPSPYTRDAAEFFTGPYAELGMGDQFTLWAIRDRVGGNLLGTIELRHQPLASGSVGYWLGARHRGAGIMTEALGTLLDHAFSDDGLALTRVEWEAVSGNAASAEVARRAGFRFEGERRLSTVFRDSRVDAWFAAILRDDPREPQDGWPE
jgi:RimJ/RimL family protein N-acetyltransferase